jgi:hypothetical protein
MVVPWRRATLGRAGAQSGCCYSSSWDSTRTVLYGKTRIVAHFLTLCMLVAPGRAHVGCETVQWCHWGLLHDTCTWPSCEACTHEHQLRQQRSAAMIALHEPLPQEGCKDAAALPCALQGTTRHKAAPSGRHTTCPHRAWAGRTVLLAHHSSDCLTQHSS